MPYFPPPLANCSSRAIQAVILLSVAIIVSSCTTVLPIDQRLAELKQLSRAPDWHTNADGVNAAKIDAAFSRLFAADVTPEQLRAMSDVELTAHSEAIESAAFYSRKVANLTPLALVLDEFTRRSKATFKMQEYFYGMLIATRQFDRAAKFKLANPTLALPAFPSIQANLNVKIGAPSEWVVHPTKQEITQQAVDLGGAWKMVVIAHPNCHFCPNAARDIFADPALKKRLTGHTKWVTPQDLDLKVEALQDWNNKFPEAQISFVHVAADWPLPSFSSTPTFYFLKDGKLVTKFSGWPKEGFKAELIAALDLVAPEKLPSQ